MQRGLPIYCWVLHYVFLDSIGHFFQKEMISTLNIDFSRACHCDGAIATEAIC